jgi:hypothetical protein
VGATAGNRNAAKHDGHGSTRNDEIRRRAGNEKRRLLDRLGLRQRDLDPIGVALLGHYATLAARIDSIDAWLDEHGLIRADGEPQPVLRFYAALHNSARLALQRLEAHLRERKVDPQAALDRHLREHYGGAE